jgi:hypothetical protein
VLVFFESGAEGVSALVQDVFRKHGREAEIIAANIDRDGYILSRIPT